MPQLLLICYISAAVQRMFWIYFAKITDGEKMKYKVSFYAEIVIKGMIK